MELPIVFITGHGDIPMTVRAMKSGAVEFLTKPFRDQDLIDAIQTAIARDRARRADARVLMELRRRFAALTPREQDIMRHVVSGRLNKQVLGDRLSGQVERFRVRSCRIRVELPASFVWPTGSASSRPNRRLHHENHPFSRPTSRAPVRTYRAMPWCGQRSQQVPLRRTLERSSVVSRREAWHGATASDRDRGRRRLDPRIAPGPHQFGGLLPVVFSSAQRFLIETPRQVYVSNCRPAIPGTTGIELYPEASPPAVPTILITAYRTTRFVLGG
jgi:hypothetical protein